MKLEQKFCITCIKKMMIYILQKESDVVQTSGMHNLRIYHLSAHRFYNER